MNCIRRGIVWLSRVFNSRGFGIQSPTDYAFVRFVVNEHWPYYAYGQLRKTVRDATARKLGKLYFRLANWRQPSVMKRDEYEAFWKAGCRKTHFADDVERLELGRLPLKGDYRDAMSQIYNKVDEQSVLVIEDIYRDWGFWHEVERDGRTAVTFDLYYCGIVFFDKKRHKKNYRVNF